MFRAREFKNIDPGIAAELNRMGMELERLSRITGQDGVEVTSDSSGVTIRVLNADNEGEPIEINDDAVFCFSFLADVDVECVDGVIVTTKQFSSVTWKPYGFLVQDECSNTAGAGGLTFDFDVAADLTVTTP